MSAKRWIPAVVSVAAILTLSAAAFAVEFEPFTEVENVCPECEQPQADVISMGSGEDIRATVVAENADFYTVERHGEVRAIPHGDVESIAWADDSKPSEITDYDQILLKNGHVLSGTIVDEKDTPAFFQIQSSLGDFTYTVAKDEVQSAYKGGSEYRFSTGEDE